MSIDMRIETRNKWKNDNMKKKKTTTTTKTQ